VKLLTEIDKNPRYLTEETATGKRLYIEGNFAVADTVNRNHRIYPMAILENEIARYRRESIDGGHAVGELNHPNPSSSGINAERVAISIKSIKRAGNYFIGKALVCDTPCGKILEGLINSGVNLGVSTRGLGSVKPLGEGVVEIQDDYRICAIDVVCDPSADAYFSTLMEEALHPHEVIAGSVEHRIKNKGLAERIEYIRSHKRGSIYAAMLRGRMK
jgi:Prohead core protein serine protease